MLPSKGYFKNEPCPFFESSKCERPYCHFRHKKYDTSNAYLATLRATLDVPHFPPLLPKPDPPQNGNKTENEPENTTVVVEKPAESKEVVGEKTERELTEKQAKALDEIVEILKRHPSRIDEILSVLKKRRSSHKSSRSSSSHRKSSRSSSSSSSRKRSSQSTTSESKKAKVENDPPPFLPETDDDDDVDVSDALCDVPTEPEPKNNGVALIKSDLPRPRTSALMAAPNPPKTRICPVSNVARMLRAPAPKVTVAATSTAPRQEHSNGWNPFFTNLTEGSSAVPAVKRNVVLKRLFTAFSESGMFPSRGEAGQEATKCESEMFEKHRDCFRKYQMMLPSILTAIKQKRYLAKNSEPTDENEWYDLLLPCVLNEEQLVDNGFPLETINESDGALKVNVFHNTAFAFNKKWKSIRDAYRKGLRYCVRCNLEYKIDPDTKLQLIPNCVFHSERIRRQRGDRFYPCCNGDVGCQLEMYHVTDQLYEDMENVVKTQPPKPGQVFHRVLALDCEMVATTNGMELAHVVIVNLSGKVVYEAHVKPTHFVTSYLTQFSGMSEEILGEKAKKDLTGIQKDLMGFITNETILIGHSLDSDLRALRIVHTLVIDTSVLYPPHEVNGDLRKQSLKRLAALHLMKAIQNDEHGHSAMEDAVASLELAKKKVEKERLGVRSEGAGDTLTAAICYRAAAERADSQAHHKHAAGLFTRAARLLLKNDPIQLHAALSCYNHATNRWAEMDNAMAGITLRETGKRLSSLEMNHSAVMMLQRAAVWFRRSPIQRLKCLTLVCSLKIQNYELEDALKTCCEIIEEGNLLPETRSRNSLLAEQEVNRILLLLLVDPVPSQVSHPDHMVLERLTWMDWEEENDERSVLAAYPGLLNLDTEHLLLLQSVVTAAQSNDVPSLCQLEGQLSRYLTPQQAHLMRSLVADH